MPPLDDEARRAETAPAETPPGPAAPESRRYWRSLERLYDSPAVAAELRPEFPDGADHAPDELSRRTMLTLMGASFALAGLEGCRRPVEHIVPYVNAPEGMVPGVPKRYATAVPAGTTAYGAVVESHEGRPTKLEGNELHPSSLGAATAFMQASVLDLYDPDRTRRPWRRGEDPADWAELEAWWAERAAEHEADGGRGLAVLAAPYASPSMERLKGELLARYPEARFVAWEPLGDENVFGGLELATGTACRPLYRLEDAKTIVALDADFLVSEPESLRHARGFARGRRPGEPSEGMSRLYAVESALTPTGASADHRLALKSRDVAAFAAALADELGVAAPGMSADGLGADARRKAAVIAEDLRGGGGVIVAGRRQPPAVHALAHALNVALGAVGSLVTLHALDDVGWGTTEELRGLVEAMRSGEATTLVVLGGNPVYDAPADLDFAGAFESFENSVHLSSWLDETSRLAAWHLPAAHFLEAWGDARAADGTLSVVQPLIAPLHGGRSALEVLALLARGVHHPGYELVRETWGERLGGAPAAPSGEEGEAVAETDPAAGNGFERRWRKVLHDGVLEGSAGAPLDLGLAGWTAPTESPMPAADGLELVFLPSAATWDGRHANNGWLQELPDAITKITWDNAALVSPATAERLGLESGELVELALGGRSLQAPVFVLPGQADDSVALAVGHGRTAAGRVGTGAGVDAYRLRATDGLGFAGGLELRPAAGGQLLAQTQEHWSMEGRELVVETTLAEYQSHPALEHGEAEEGAHHLQLFPDFEYDESPQWGMAIDLNACIGCNACIVACQSENNIPVVGKEQVARGREMQWLRVDRYFSGDPEAPGVAFQPVPCMHCENAPCEQVCPVAATVHDSEGLNAMVYNRCIGTRYCSNNCPYKVRRFNFFNYTKDTPELMKMAMNPDVTVRSRGVMEKCTYCVQRLSEAKIAAKRDGRELRDGDARTACQQTCPAEAIAFGDILDPESEVSRWKADERNYVLIDGLNNRPRTTYLARLRNPNPAWEAS